MLNNNVKSLSGLIALALIFWGYFEIFDLPFQNPACNKNKRIPENGAGNLICPNSFSLLINGPTICFVTFWLRSIRVELHIFVLILAYWELEIRFLQILAGIFHNQFSKKNIAFKKWLLGVNKYFQHTCSVSKYISHIPVTSSQNSGMYFSFIYHIWF